MNSLRRIIAAVGVLALLTAAIPAAFAAEPVEADVRRVYGQTRYETALKIGQVLQEKTETYKFDAVVLASGKNFPDALAGSYLAVRENAPILMVNEDNHETVKAYLEEHLAPGGTVFILGGEKAVAPELEETLSAWEVRRLQGSTRYETNLAILEQTGVSGGQILVCTGRDFADSLSAAAANRPILLVGDQLTQAQKTYLETLEQADFCVIGGEQAVCPELAAELEAYGTVSRLAGATRQETSVAVAEAFFPEPRAAVLAYAWNFPDGLCGGPLAVAVGGPVLLVTDEAYDGAREYVSGQGITDGLVLGGSGLISDGTASDIFGLESSAIPDWNSRKAEMSQVKPENVGAATAFIDKLYDENKSADPLSGTYTWQEKGSSSWIYYNGLVHDGFMMRDSERYSELIRDFYTQHIHDNGTIRKYAVGTLDAALPAVNIISLLETDELTPEEREKYEKAVNYVYNELEKQVSYPEAGDLLQHAQSVDGGTVAGWDRWVICLDGIFMSQLFMIRLTEAIDAGIVAVSGPEGFPVTSKEIWEGVYTRMAFPMEHMRDPETGLLYHGYCVAEERTNGIFWSRAMGWYAMALLEAAAKCPDAEKKEVLTGYFEQLMDAVVKWQDGDTFLWYNVTNAKEEVTLVKDGETIENKPESSGSAMFAYCLLRGYHEGLLQDDSFRAAGLCAFNGLVETKLTEEGLTDICLKSAVYTSQNMYQVFGYATNDGKGVGPFIMAANYAY